MREGDGGESVWLRRREGGEALRKRKRRRVGGGERGLGTISRREGRERLLQTFLLFKKFL